MDLIFILFILIFMLTLMNLKFQNGDPFAPSSVFLEVFTFSIFCALLNYRNWNIHYSFGAFILIFSGCLVFTTTDYLVLSMRKKRAHKSRSFQNTANHKPIIIDRWKMVLLILIQVATILWDWRVISAIAKKGSFFGGSLLYNYRMITSYSNTLGSDEGVPFILGQLLKLSTVFCFISVMIILYNVIVAKTKIRKNILFFIPVGLYFAQSIIGAARSDLLHLFTFSIIVAVVFNQYRHNWRAKLPIKTMVKIVSLVAFVLFVFYELSSVIGRTFSQLNIFSYLSIYTGGSIQHFNQYITEGGVINKYWGQETLANVYRFLWKIGMIDSYPIVHLEVRHLNAYLTGNVYTFFRRLIQDYGYLGMYAYTILCSSFYSYYYNVKIKYQEINYKYLKRLFFYAYIMHMMFMASIEQTIFGYLSNSFLNLIIIANLTFWFLLKIKINGRLGTRVVNTVEDHV